MITPSLETCKLLKDKGWNKVSKLLWVDNEEWGIHLELWDGHEPNNYIACTPTAEEIAEELPETIERKGIKYFLGFNKYNGEYSAWYQHEFHGGNETYDAILCSHASLSEALAQLWIWCVENGDIKAKEGL